MDIKQFNKTSEELYTDFFDSQKVENDVLASKKITGDFCKYNYDGFDYKIPVQQHNDSHSLQSFRFIYGQQQIGTESGNILYNNICKSDKLFILTKVNEWDRQLSYQIDVLLYKKRIAEPLIWQKSEINLKNNDDEANLICDSEWSKLTPGEYFILLTNVHNPSEENEEHINHFWYPFVLLADGNAVRHPQIKSTKITIGCAEGGRNVRVCAESDFAKRSYRQAEDFHLEIKLDSALRPVQQLSASCYNPQWLFMGKCSGQTDSNMPSVKANHSHSNSNIKAINNAYDDTLIHFKFSSPHIWTKGAYFIILQDNQIPIAKINFHLNGNDIIVDKPEKITGDKKFAILTNFLENNKSWTDDFQTLPGMANIRQKIWEQSECYATNKLRRSHNLAAIATAPHFLLIGPENGYKANIAKTISEFSNNLKSFRHERAKGIIEEQRHKEKTYADFHYTGSVICYSSSNYIDNISALISAEGTSILEKIEGALQSELTGWSLTFGGTETEIRQLFEFAPYLKEYFPPQNHFYVQSFSVEDVIFIIKQKLELMSVRIYPEALEKLHKFLKSEEEHGRLQSWNQTIIERFINEQLITPLQQKIFTCGAYTRNFDINMLTTITPDDLNRLAHTKDNNNSFAECMSLFDNLVGLNSLKDNVKDMFNLIYFNDMRRKNGFPVQQATSHHMVFTGNPGTGKTTVAKLIGKIYHALGIISKGGVIVTERSKIVGRYIGDTEKNMLGILSKAQGNVLFIDEAYSLCDCKSDRKDFGQRAIEALLTVLSQDNPDMIVIFAGYQKEMDYMMETNIGLQGRFPHKFHFEDYSDEELLQIGDMITEKGEYIFTPEARELWINYVTDAYCEKDRFFSNARWINQTVNHGLLTIMAQRVMQHQEIQDKAFLQTIEKEDIQTLITKTKKQNEVINIRPVVGFRA